jgi:hypothetical protein
MKMKFIKFKANKATFRESCANGQVCNEKLGLLCQNLCLCSSLQFFDGQKCCNLQKFTKNQNVY